MFRFASLLEPVSPAGPCGPNLEYEVEFLTLEAAVRSAPEQRIGAAIRPAVPPDWPVAGRLAIDLLTRSKDLRVAWHLTRAELCLRGLPGLADGLQLLSRLLGLFQDQLHPTEVSEDCRAPRLDGEGLAWDLRTTRLFEVPIRITVHDIELSQSRRAYETALFERTLSEALLRSPDLRNATHACLDWADSFDRTFASIFVHRFDRLEDVPRPLSLVRNILRRLLPEEPLRKLPFAATPAVQLSPSGAGPRLPRDSRPVLAPLPYPEPDSLLTPISAHDPCGPDLEYDAAFWYLQQAMAGRPERQIGHIVEPAQPPDWAQVQSLAQALLSRTKDLRVAVAWTRAMIWTNGAEGAAAGLELVDALLSRWWDEVHPRVEPDDDDLTMRRSALGLLSAERGLFADLRALGFDDLAIEVSSGSNVTEAFPRIRRALHRIRYTLAVRMNDEPALVGFGPATDDPAAVIDKSGRVDGASLPPARVLTEAVDEAASQALLDALCSLIATAVVDPAAACRRAHRLTIPEFIDLVRGLSPERSQHAESFLLGRLDAESGRSVKVDW